MKYIKLDPNIQSKLNEALQKCPRIIPIIEKIDEAGGVALLVGGAVRDLLLGLPIKDLDIEVHKLSLASLKTILGECGAVDEVGSAFGVLRLHGLDVDWSVPRSDAPGRKPQVRIDPFMEMQSAFARRDLTINAMGIDLVSKQLLDPFDGLTDLRKGVLRAPNVERFVEDPLRFFRVMQFIGRFGFEPDDELNKLCIRMDLSGVSRERIETEFEKLLLRSTQPSRGLRWLNAIGRFEEVLPELAATKEIEQDERWHPEGNVFEHSLQSLDAAAVLEYSYNREKRAVLYAALCHDLGKVGTTERVDGELKSLGHEKAGVALTKKMLKRITQNADLIDTVCKLVRYHMHPVQFVEGGAKPSAYKRLANKLGPEVTLQMLAQLALADKRGRNPAGATPLNIDSKEIEAFLGEADKAEVLEQVEKPVLQGRDLLDVMEPGPDMGAVLKKAYELQLEEGIKDKEVLKKRVLEK